MCLLIILILLFQNSIGCAYASNINSCYARIMQDDVYLYKNAVDIDDYSNVYFTLPRTYFVELIASENSKFYKVNYLNFNGYVKKECVQPIVGTPLTPYLTNVNFRVFSEQSRDMRLAPNTENGSNGQVVYLPLLTKNLTYYGSIIGEAIIENRTNIWYYCKYSADKDYYGYVYSDFCDEMSPTPLNTEAVTYATNPNFGEIEEPTNALPMENKTTSVVIAVLCVPAVLFAFLMLKNSKIMKKQNTENSEVKYY